MPLDNDLTYTLLSWVARNHDPERLPKDAPEGTPPALGPTLTLLTHPRSPYRDNVRRVIMLAQQDDTSQSAAKRTLARLRKTHPSIASEIKSIPLSGPTDHLAIRDAVLPIYRNLLREQRRGQKLLVNLSPGTPAMHAVWVLLTQTDPDFERKGELVETREERYTKDGDPMVHAVDLDLRTEFKLHATRVLESASAETPPIVQPSELKSPVHRRFYDEVERVAKLRVPVLIRGERGTGKTTVASLIRSRTPYAGEPNGDIAWQVACGSFSPELLAAELFGYVKGAFTGATKNTDGLLQTIGHGALFLDEVGDLSKPMQRTLIKAVEEGEYRPVGSSTTRQTNARFVFATNVSEAELTERIDADFLDRVGYIRLHVPPLRKCREDIPELWRQVASSAGRRADFDLDARLDEQAHAAIVEQLQSAPLLGNFRDLYRVAYRLCVELQRDIPTLDAIEAAFQTLSASQAPAAQQSEQNPAFASAISAWLRQESLNTTLLTHGAVPVAAEMKDLRHWLGKELTQSAKTLGLRASEVSDLPDRTLREWAKSKRPAPETSRRGATKGSSEAK